MKQHITVEQVWELVKNGNVWDSITNYNTLANIQFNKPCNCFQDTCKITAEQTTIGKMIEILDNYHSKLYNKLDIYKNDLDEWCIVLNTGMEIVFLEYNDELCDALWEAVKKIIREVE